jgi:hypothetical protein
VILFVKLEVLSQLANTFTENRNLHFRATRVTVMGAKARNNFGFLCSCQHGSALLLYVKSSPLSKCLTKNNMPSILASTQREPPRFPLWPSRQARAARHVAQSKPSLSRAASRIDAALGKLLFHHHRAAAWPIAIKEKGQRHHQDSGKRQHVVDVDIRQGLGLRLEMVVDLPLGQV